jgi:hypothetical protein
MKDRRCSFAAWLVVSMAVAAATATACGLDSGQAASPPALDARAPVNANDPASVVGGARTKTVMVGLAPPSDGELPGAVPPETVGAAALTDVGGLPFLALDEHSRHASSYDRSGGNVDFGNAYGVDAAGNWILLDARGPGCIYRMWFTGFAGSDELKVFFDDATLPQIDTTLAALFAGQTAPFTPPLVGNDAVSSGGFFSYVPLPFGRSVRITVTPDNGLYDNIDYRTLPADAPPATWTGSEDLSAARAMWSAAGSEPPGTAAGIPIASVEGTCDLPPSATVPVFEGSGPGEVSALELRIPGVAPPVLDVDAGTDGGEPATSDGGADGGGLGPASDLLGALWVTMTWDGEATPSVDAPVGSLFALGDLGTGASGGLMAGIRADGTLYLYFPMPFAKSARLALANRGSTAVTNVWARVEQRSFPFAFDEVGTFTAAYHAGPSTAGADLTLLETGGSGKVVGVVVTEARQACSKCFVRDYLEGDEHILVDEARTPVVLGTGTEDFFNGGFYFNRGPFGLPTHGNVVHVSTAAYDATSAYRFFLGDAITYRDGVRLSLQHGPIDNDDVVASTLVYSYEQPRTRLVLSDGFVVGDPAGEERHAYATTAPTWSGSFKATFEGEFDTAALTSTGRANEGTSTFAMAVDPTNCGVVLRRLLNQATGNQRAQVTVNGVVVGDWLTAGANLDHAWREDDFAIPGSITSGQSTLAIELRFVSSNADWNAFEYEAYAELP